MSDLQALLAGVLKGDSRSLGRAISTVECRLEGFEAFLNLLTQQARVPAKVLAFTGVAGSGKSTLVAKLAGLLSAHKKKVAVLAVDPSSPISGGALLGDRIRMPHLADNPLVFMRSVASRGAKGGSSSCVPDLVEILEVAKFDYILIETVGAGQGDYEIRDLVDHLGLLLIPEAGDQIQMIKAGLMEVADFYLLNKTDLPGSNKLEADLKNVLFGQDKPIFRNSREEKTADGLLNFCLSYQVNSILRLEKQKALAGKRLLAECLGLFEARLLESSEFKKVLDQVIASKLHPVYAGRQIRFEIK